MGKVTVSYKTKNSLIDKILQKEQISLIKNDGLLSSLPFIKKRYADVHFTSGVLNKDEIKKVENSKITIVNSLASKYELINNYGIEEDKIKVIYPSVDIEYEKPKIVKQRVCEKLDIDSKKKLIFFTAKKFKNSGAREFIEVIFSLSEDNFQAIIAGDSNQITNLKFHLSKFNYSNKIVLVENHENIDELFLAADIFFLPTNYKAFAANVLKAMYCKCVVFTTAINHSKELIDIFSTMENPSDKSATFKIDAVLMQKEEMKSIKKQNRDIAKNYTLEKNLNRFEEILASI
ncbi:MAG: glycosyltransferase [Campylobacterota bacterium]